MKKTLFLLISAFLLTFNASAQELNDFGSWTHFMFIKNINKAYAMARAEYRTCDNMKSSEAWFVMAGGGYNFTKWLQGDLSYEFWGLPAHGNNYAHKAVACVTANLRSNALSFMLKEKYEFAVTAGSKVSTHLMRSRLKCEYREQNWVVGPYLMYEIFNGFGGTGWIRSLNYAGADIYINKHNILDIYYMYHLYNAAGSLGSRHLIGVGYTLVL